MSKKQKTNPAAQRNRPARLDWRKSLGKLGEQYVIDLLKRSGWQIVERNWRAGRYAEMDIIASDPAKTLVFIEVKTRIKNDNPSGFIDAGFDKLDQRKITKMVSLSRLYMAKCLGKNARSDQGCRFDAFVIYFPASVRQAEWHLFNTIDQMNSFKPEVLHIKDLFA